MQAFFQRYSMYPAYPPVTLVDSIPLLSLPIGGRTEGEISSFSNIFSTNVSSRFMTAGVIASGFIE